MTRIAASGTSTETPKKVQLQKNWLCQVKINERGDLYSQKFMLQINQTIKFYGKQTDLQGDTHTKMWFERYWYHTSPCTFAAYFQNTFS